MWHERAGFVSTNSKDRKSTRLNSSHGYISYAVFCLKKKKKQQSQDTRGGLAYPPASVRSRCIRAVVVVSVGVTRIIPWSSPSLLLLLFFFFLMIGRPPKSPLFPSTTLFRSRDDFRGGAHGPRPPAAFARRPVPPL